jgi:hypothetical protein
MPSDSHEYPNHAQHNAEMVAVRNSAFEALSPNEYFRVCHMAPAMYALLVQAQEVLAEGPMGGPARRLELLRKVDLLLEGIPD